ncbi:MAG TPA: chain length-determining protein, partial [Gammaproteobacteria bacterium]|nr:chain length-determining protein [Gammaproteobacteria bacterium]
VVDPPYVPLLPVSPKRGLLLALVFVFALGMGGVFAFFMHQITPVFLNMKSLRELGDYTVLGAFSMIVSKTQKNLYRRELVGFSATLILLLTVAVLGIVFDGHLANLVQHFFVMGSS